MTDFEPKSKLAAIILCGGHSSRMGFDKFRLPLNGRTFLEWVVEKLASVVDGPVIAAASERTLAEVEKIRDRLSLDRFNVVVDQRDDSGPLEGIRVGLHAAESHSRWAFVTSCDVPLICPEVLHVLQESIEDANQTDIEAVMPMSPERIYGMTAIYRSSIIPKVAQMIERKQLRVTELATVLNTARISLDEIRKADPNLDSMKNLNSPSQYLEFLRSRGFDCPPEIEEQLHS